MTEIPFRIFMTCNLIMIITAISGVIAQAYKFKVLAFVMFFLLILASLGTAGSMLLAIWS